MSAGWFFYMYMHWLSIIALVIIILWCFLAIVSIKFRIIFKNNKLMQNVFLVLLIHAAFFPKYWVHKPWHPVWQEKEGVGFANTKVAGYYFPLDAQIKWRESYGEQALQEVTFSKPIQLGSFMVTHIGPIEQEGDVDLKITLQQDSMVGGWLCKQGHPVEFWQDTAIQQMKLAACILAKAPDFTYGVQFKRPILAIVSSKEMYGGAYTTNVVETEFQTGYYKKSPGNQFDEECTFESVGYTSCSLRIVEQGQKSVEFFFEGANRAGEYVHIQKVSPPNNLVVLQKAQKIAGYSFPEGTVLSVVYKDNLESFYYARFPHPLNMYGVRVLEMARQPIYSFFQRSAQDRSEAYIRKDKAFLFVDANQRVSGWPCNTDYLVGAYIDHSNKKFLLGECNFGKFSGNEQSGAMQDKALSIKWLRDAGSDANKDILTPVRKIHGPTSELKNYFKFFGKNRVNCDVSVNEFGEALHYDDCNVVLPFTFGDVQLIPAIINPEYTDKFVIPFTFAYNPAKPEDSYVYFTLLEDYKVIYLKNNLPNTHTEVSPEPILKMNMLGEVLPLNPVCEPYDKDVKC